MLDEPPLIVRMDELAGSMDVETGSLLLLDIRSGRRMCRADCNYGIVRIHIVFLLVSCRSLIAFCLPSVGRRKGIGLV
jgi:hypothetical protein